MCAFIRERSILDGLQSASGLERLEDFYFVVGDDSPHLARYDLEWKHIGTTLLFASDVHEGERISKAAKPDLEAMCAVEWKGRRELLCFGSGSKSPARDTCYRVDVTNPAMPGQVRMVSLIPLYDALRANAEIVGARTLNIEAATATKDAILLFQRGNISGINAVMEYDLGAFMQYLEGETVIAPTPEVRTYALPKIGTRWAGFSAAMTLEDGILFSASVEDTDNEIDDGETLGSFIGLIAEGELKWVCRVEGEAGIASVKIEGITCRTRDAVGWEIFAVTDNDLDASEILRVSIQ